MRPPQKPFPIPWPVLPVAISMVISLFPLPQAEGKPPEKPAGALDVELEDLRPGLLAVYRSATDRDATLTRIDLKPSFTLGHSSVHPRLPPGPFEAVWTGVLFLKEPAPVAFSAFVGGE